MKPNFQRLCIYPNDIQIISGKSYRQSLGLIKKIKRHYNKSNEAFLTIQEFCDYTQISYRDVTQQLQN